MCNVLPVPVLCTVQYLMCEEVTGVLGGGHAGEGQGDGSVTN